MEIQSQPRSLPSLLSIWIEPRETIRRIVEKNPTKYVILLAALAGIGQALNSASSRNAGDTMPLLAILGVCFLLGPLGGIVSLYIGGEIYRWSGMWLGGTASSEEVRAAIAWSSVPTIFVLPLWILELLIFGKEMFTSSMPQVNANPFLSTILLGFAIVEIVVGLWAFIVFLQSLGEVHGFSGWRALGAVFLGSLIILLPIFCVVGFFLAVSIL